MKKTPTNLLVIAMMVYVIIRLAYCAHRYELWDAIKEEWSEQQERPVSVSASVLRSRIMGHWYGYDTIGQMVAETYLVLKDYRIVYRKVILSNIGMENNWEIEQMGWWDLTKNGPPGSNEYELHLNMDKPRDAFYRFPEKYAVAYEDFLNKRRLALHLVNASMNELVMPGFIQINSLHKPVVEELDPRIRVYLGFYRLQIDEKKAINFLLQLQQQYSEEPGDLNYLALRMDSLFNIYVRFADTNYPIGFIEERKNKLYFSSLNWDNQRNSASAGKLRNINYINEKGVARTGSLKLYFDPSAPQESAFSLLEK